MTYSAAIDPAGKSLSDILVLQSALTLSVGGRTELMIFVTSSESQPDGTQMSKVIVVLN